MEIVAMLSPMGNISITTFIEFKFPYGVFVVILFSESIVWKPIEIKG